MAIVMDDSKSNGNQNVEIRRDQKPLAAENDPVRVEILSVLGPGLISGAADDDPSGIATYSQVGAQFGFALGWTMLFSYPLMVAMQGISAGIGAVTGQGIAKNLRRHYSSWVLRLAVALLLCANLVNIGTDLNAMAAALQLLLPGPVTFFSVGFGLVCVVAEIFVSYREYVHVLRWLTLSLFAYVAVVFTVQIPWSVALEGTFVPNTVLDRDHATAFVALMGTTISPYLFFWQAGEEVEELHRRRSPRLGVWPRKATQEIRRIKLDTLVGMGFSNAVALFIIWASAATLHPAGTTHIDTAAQAAAALRPIAGEFAFAVFAIGIIGTGLLAVPVLAGSCAYAIAETFNWPEGLDRPLKEAKGFYATIALSTLGSLGVGYTGIDPITALYMSAVLNGILGVPLMVIMIAIARNPRIMGRLTAPTWMSVIASAAVLVTSLATVGLFIL